MCWILPAVDTFDAICIVCSVRQDMQEKSCQAVSKIHNGERIRVNAATDQYCAISYSVSELL